MLSAQGPTRRPPILLRFVITAALGVALTVLVPVMPDAEARPVTLLHQRDFTYGTYVIDRPGNYRLAEDIEFNPNSPSTLTRAVNAGTIPTDVAQALDLGTPVDASRSGLPLPTQLTPSDSENFTPGGPLDARYDAAAYAVGFFAAIAITADEVTLDLAGHTIAQSPEHALLQRFFAVIELADQPFVPGQGPSGFGAELVAARNVTIRNGVIGLSSHHGIHGNGNSNVTVRGVTFDGYEVAAIALNGVDGLDVRNVVATNRKDVPVLGTFSSARFIQPYVDHLVRTGSGVTLTVGGAPMSASDVQSDLRRAIDNTHHDLIRRPHLVDGRPQINRDTHPVEYAVFHNPLGVIDGNSYSFLLNSLGVAVNGFPSIPLDADHVPSRHVYFENVEVVDQEAFVNEVVAIRVADTAAIDPVGAVFQVKNLHPDTGMPITVSSLDDERALYLGNPVANAQALVAKSAANGAFDGSPLDVSRENIPDALIEWIESDSLTLSDVDVEYFCNGDSMFHVNKGVIAFKMDAASDVQMVHTRVDGLVNRGHEGSSVCGEYLHGFSHPLSTVYGYGGSVVRGYSFAGSTEVLVNQAEVKNLHALEGSAIGFDVMTDSTDIRMTSTIVNQVIAGSNTPLDGGSTAQPEAIGIRVSEDAEGVVIVRGCAIGLHGTSGATFLFDGSGSAVTRGTCPESRQLLDRTT